jgi:hypothetical protein
MLSLQMHLSQTTSTWAEVASATEALELRNVLTGALLFGALATFAALMSATGRLFSQAVQLLKEALRLLLLAAVAGLVVAALVILALAEQVAR